MMKISRAKRVYLLNYLSYLLTRENWRTCVLIDGECSAVLSGGHNGFCADCFPFVHQGVLYVFYETVDSKGKGLIGCYKYEKGEWCQLGIVLEQPWHMSYPQIIKEGDRIFMIPEQSDKGRGDVSIYEATNFPFDWVKRATLITRPFADPTVIKKDNYYYMACYVIPPFESAELWCAPTIFGPWKRHPQWYNISQSKRLRRCGGMFIEEGASLYRVAQDCNGGYGKRLFKVKVKKLSPCDYEEGSSELLLDCRGRSNVVGAHTFNVIFWQNKKIVCYDVKKNAVRNVWPILKDVWRLFVRKVAKCTSAKI